MELSFDGDNQYQHLEKWTQFNWRQQPKRCFYQKHACMDSTGGGTRSGPATHGQKAGMTQISWAIAGVRQAQQILPA